MKQKRVYYESKGGIAIQEGDERKGKKKKKWVSYLNFNHVGKDPNKYPEHIYKTENQKKNRQSSIRIKLSIKYAPSSI